MTHGAELAEETPVAAVRAVGVVDVVRAEPREEQRREHDARAADGAEADLREQRRERDWREQAEHAVQQLDEADGELRGGPSGGVGARRRGAGEANVGFNVGVGRGVRTSAYASFAKDGRARSACRRGDCAAVNL